MQVMRGDTYVRLSILSLLLSHRTEKVTRLHLIQEDSAFHFSNISGKICTSHSSQDHRLNWGLFM